MRKIAYEVVRWISPDRVVVRRKVAKPVPHLSKVLGIINGKGL